MTMEIRVLLVDDHQILRNGVRSVIEKKHQVKVVGEAKNGREAIKLCKRLNPDVVIMDVAMEGLNGIEATARCIEENPNLKIIALSMHSNKRFVLGMFKAGAYGYLLKDCDSDELVKAIKTVAANQKYITPKISGIILNELNTNYSDTDDMLTFREKEVLQLIAEGKSSKDIGEILFLSSKTVDTHRKNIMDKLEIRTIPELTKYAIKLGLTGLDD